MKRLCVLLALVVMASLFVPAVAMATDPVPLDGTVTSAAAGTPLYVPAGWLAGTRGLAMSGPSIQRFFFSIVDQDHPGTVVCGTTPAQSRLYWDPTAVAVDPSEYGLEHFNAHSGAGYWARWWQYDIPGGLPAGTYTFSGSGVQMRKAVDGLIWVPGQHSVFHLVPPDWDFTLEFTLTVTP